MPALELPWIVLGPRSAGSNYGIVTFSPDAPLTREVRTFLNDYALTTLGAPPLRRRYLSLFQLGDGAAPWFLGATALEERITWGLLLTIEQLTAMRFDLAPLVSAFPRVDAKVVQSPAPLRWEPVLSQRKMNNQIDSIAPIARTLPLLLRTPSWLAPEAAALEILSRVQPMSASLASRADLQPRGSLAQLPMPNIVTFSRDDPAADWTRYASYQAVSLEEDDSLQNAPQIPEGVTEWNKLLDASYRLFPDYYESLAETMKVSVEASPGDAPGYVAAKIGKIAGGIDGRADNRTLSAATALLHAAAHIAGNGGGTMLIEAAHRGFEDATPDKPAAAARFVDFYVRSIAQDFPAARRVHFAAELSAKRNAIFLLGDTTLNVIVEKLVDEPQLLSGSLAAREGEPAALRIVLGAVAQRLRSAPSIALGQAAARLFMHWASMPARTSAADVETLVEGLAAAPLQGLLARALIGGGATALRSVMSERAFLGLLDKIALRFKKTNFYQAENKEELEDRLLLAVHICNLSA